MPGVLYNPPLHFLSTCFPALLLGKEDHVCTPPSWRRGVQRETVACARPAVRSVQAPCSNLPAQHSSQPDSLPVILQPQQGQEAREP